MTETQYQAPISPPRKQRDPLLTGRSKDELQQTQEKYISETVKSAARESLRQGTMNYTPIPVGREGKKKIDELQSKLCISQKVLLNMAFAFAYNEAKTTQFSVQKLREQVEAQVKDTESVFFEIDESTLDILFECGIEDAQFIFLNAGIDLLYFRLVNSSQLSSIWQ
jgi:hypothetical protein